MEKGNIGSLQANVTLSVHTSIVAGHRLPYPGNGIHCPIAWCARNATDKRGVAVHVPMLRETRGRAHAGSDRARLHGDKSRVRRKHVNHAGFNAS